MISRIHDKAWVASFSFAMKMVCQFYPIICSTCEWYRKKWPTWSQNIISVAKDHSPDIVCVASDDSGDTLIFWKDQVAGCHYTCKNQHSLCENVVKARNAKIVDALNAKGDLAGLNWFLSGCFLGSGSWISHSTFSVEASFSSIHFRVNLCRRLLIHSPHLAVNQNLVCSLCNTEDVDDRYHCVSCKELNRITIKRHDLIVSDLYKTLKNLVGRGFVDNECLLNNDANMRMDIVVTIHGVQYYIDVTVVNPASRSHSSAHSHVLPKAVTLAAEGSKRRKYDAALSRLGVNQIHFIPFVLCSSGLMGPAAKDWFDYVCNLPE